MSQLVHPELLLFSFVFFFLTLLFTMLRCQRSFSYQAPVTWNQLPVSDRQSTSVGAFLFLEDRSLFKNHSFSPIAQKYDSLSLSVRVCVRVCVCAHACVRV